MQRKWVDFRLSEREEILTESKVYDALMKIGLFMNHWQQEDFNKMFGKDGPNMLKKFHKYNNNVIKFFEYMDGSNRKIFSDYVEKNFKG